jgi:hypothetical protein
MAPSPPGWRGIRTRSGCPLVAGLTGNFLLAIRMKWPVRQVKLFGRNES